MHEGIRSQIEDALRNTGTDYVEVRVEEAESSHVRFRGSDLEEIGRSSGMGGSVRALAGGGWGFISFNDLDGLRDKVKLAVQQARIVGGEPVVMAPVPPVIDVVPPRVGSRNPAEVPLARKKAVLEQYARIMQGVEGVQSSSVNYGDGRRRVIFASSEGSYIDQERLDVSMRLSAMARNGGEVQQAGESLGSLGDFGFVESLHEQAREVAEKAVLLLKAPQVKGGEYTVILDPILAGVFIHEAFGHLSEADHIYAEPRLQELMVLGRKFGGPHLNVVDGAAVPALRGSFNYDDEGVAGTRTDLIREGVLVGRLHSRETAGKLGERPTGNARAISYRFPPIVRMTNTFIVPATNEPRDLFDGVKEGVYVKNWYGGMTSMEMFTFSAGEAHMIRDGKVAELCRPVMLSGNLFTTLHNLDMVANDLDMNQGGGCGKNGQSPMPVSNGSPHIRIRKTLIGGGAHAG